MNAWVLGIIGVVFLGVMVDIVTPDGKTNAFIKSIFAIVFMYIVISPILQLVNDSGIDVSKIFVQIDEDVEHIKFENKCKIENYLFDKGIEGVIVEVDGYSTSNDFILDKIYVNIDNLVINKNVEHINEYKLITSMIMEIVEVSEEDIIYG